MSERLDSPTVVDGVYCGWSDREVEIVVLRLQCSRYGRLPGEIRTAVLMACAQIAPSNGRELLHELADKMLR